MWNSTKLITKFLNFYGNLQIRYASQVLPQLSFERYNIERGNFSTVQIGDVEHFKSILGQERVITEEYDIVPYNVDWFKQYRGQSKVVLKPKTTEEVSSILSYCNRKLLAVCPQGGNTGVVGGSIPVFDEIILNLGLMNKIINIDEISGVMVCEAGCILEDLERLASKHNVIMPLDLGAKGSCQIGGNLSTNAGGLRVVRYGNLHGSVLGLEVVKADGTIIDCLKSLKKDNTGYHLNHLFIGSEGTLGVVTKVAIQCPVKPNAVTLGYFGVQNFHDILTVYKNAKSALGEILSAFEMADLKVITHTTKTLQLQNPLAEYPFYVILETHGSNEAHDNEKLTKFLTNALENNVILDGIVTSEPSKMRAIWDIRERVIMALAKNSYVLTYDLSVPQKKNYDLVLKLRQRLGDKVDIVCGVGHIGDGNIHLIITMPKYSQEVNSLIEPFIYEEVAKLKGSISAEHGIGIEKLKSIHYSKNATAIQLMKDLKQLMDPNGILNPYKVISL